MGIRSQVITPIHRTRAARLIGRIATRAITGARKLLIRDISMTASGPLRTVLLAGVLLLASGCQAQTGQDAPAGAAVPSPGGYTADGRRPLDELFSRFGSLSTDHGWQAETVYTYPGEDHLAIRAWRTAHRGEALWILAGIHGEEPAGANAIAASLGRIAALAASGVPVVVVPLCNPKAYRNNWRYPNTPERDWRKGGYSVGDAEYLLPDLATGAAPRAPAAPGPDTLALTEFALRLAGSYPPLLVLDLHEDELSTAGGYIYSQGRQAENNPVGVEIIRLLQSAGMSLRLAGHTRFGEPIADGVISRDDRGNPIRDGSIGELFAASHVFRDGKIAAGPAARTVIVVETPAFAGSKLGLRVAAQSAVLDQIRELWRLNAALPR